MRTRCSTWRDTPFVVDDSGKKTAVLLAIEAYKKRIEEAEELEVIRAMMQCGRQRAKRLHLSRL